MRERRLGDVINLMIADHSSGGVRVTSQQLVLVLSPTKGAADIIMQEDLAGPQGGEDSRAEVDNVQRKIRSSLTLNLSDGSRQTEDVAASNSGQQTGDDKRSSRLSKSLQSSIRREFVEQNVSSSPCLARSPAMHEGFHIKDWKVERTPINTPDSVVVTNIVPKLSDDEEEVEESDTVSETDPISKGSGTSSYLPSSVDVSESRAGCCEKTQTVEMHLSEDAELASGEQVALERSAVALQVEASTNLVKPPAGFTDSPVRILPPEFSTAEDSQTTRDSELLVLHQENHSANITPDIVACQKYKTYNQENFGQRDVSYHHPELVVCQRQGNFSYDNIDNLIKVSVEKYFLF